MDGREKPLSGHCLHYRGLCLLFPWSGAPLHPPQIWKSQQQLRHSKLIAPACPPPTLFYMHGEGHLLIVQACLSVCLFVHLISMHVVTLMLAALLRVDVYAAFE